MVGVGWSSGPGSNLPAAVSKLGQFRSPHIACVFQKKHQNHCYKKMPHKGIPY